MSGLYDQAAARLAPDRCPAVLQAAVGADGEAAAEMFALAPDVSALVHSISDRADPVSTAAFKVSQRVTVLFGVTMALVYPGGYPQFEAAEAQIKAALRGWTPEGFDAPVQYAGGRTLQYRIGEDGGRWLHLLTFSTSFRETYEAQA